MTLCRTRYKNFVDELQRKKNRTNASVRAKVEHPFRILKRVFSFEKIRYRGLAKNHNRLCACFALVDLYTCTANGWPRLRRSVSKTRVHGGPR